MYEKIKLGLKASKTEDKVLFKANFDLTTIDQKIKNKLLRDASNGKSEKKTII